MIHIRRNSVPMLMLVVLVSACRDPEEEAALVAELDGFDVPDVQGDAIDVNFDALDVQTDAWDVQVDAQSDVFEVQVDVADVQVADVQVDAPDVAIDAADVQADVADAQIDAPDVDLCASVTCTDKLPCQSGICSPTTGQCSYTNVLTVVPCSDGDPCTVNDTCANGACVKGAVDDCDDSKDCTTDSCVTGTGCKHDNNTTSCDDGNPCTADDGCSSGVCVPGTATLCNDSNVCTTDSCDPAKGCVYANNTASCDADGSLCTDNDKCANGGCAAGVAKNCDDSNACTQDACAPTVGCSWSALNAAPCEDGDACTVNDSCTGKNCTAGAAKNCIDGSVCTTDTCTPVTGVCVNTAVSPAGQPCDDGSACTGPDLCAGTACTGAVSVVCDDTNPCTVDSCDPKSGCVHPSALDETGCGASQYCLAGKCIVAQCNDGVTQAFLGEQCDDGNGKDGDGCSSGCQIELTCGNGTCDGTETVYSCPGDCKFLANRFGGACAMTGSNADCTAGYSCVPRSGAGGGNVCVADFPSWSAVADSHPASDFITSTDFVTDTRTGLMWAKDTTAASSFAAALGTECSGKSYGGFQDWRLPTRSELLSLIDLTAAGSPASSAPNLTWPADGNWRYWTAFHSTGALALDVNFAYGNNDAFADTSLAHVRCVRAGQPSTAASGVGVRFAALDNGTTVLDRLTGLRWQQGIQTAIKWNDAANVCISNTAGLTGTGWRLPTRHELESIVNVQLTNPALDAIFKAGASDQFWTSSVSVILNNAWTVFFTFGNTYYRDENFAYNVRCVRDCEGDCSAVCGDGFCGGSETASSCASDCGFLTTRVAGTCSNPGSQDACGSGYSCGVRGADKVCVADFDVWPTLSTSHPASDFSSTDGSTFKDNRTGLIWGAKADVVATFADAMTNCMTSSVVGKTDWRVPTAAELGSLLAFTPGASQATASPLQFAGNKTVWTSNLVTLSPLVGWTIDFATGTLLTAATSTAYAGLCVRSEDPPVTTGSGTRFAIEAGNATVLDRTSGLHWERGATFVDFPGAQAHCESLNAKLPGWTWRLPSVTELRGLIERESTSASAFDATFSNPPYDLYWTSTTSGSSVWTVSSYNGSSATQPDTGKLTARCVRTGPSIGSPYCGDGVCNAAETFDSCPADCGFLRKHVAGKCSSPFAQDVCNDGYLCLPLGAPTNTHCVASFATWAPIGDTHAASDFLVYADYVIDVKTKLAWTKGHSSEIDISSVPSFCLSQTVGGFADWRLPSRMELLSLLDGSKTAPASSAPITWDGGVNKDSFNYWAIVPNQGGSNAGAWWIDFNLGAVVDPTASTARVRCVRGGSSVGTGAGSRFALQESGTTVLDRGSGLAWELATPATQTTWSDANSWCKNNNSALAGTGWRLPTLQELADLTDPLQTSPSISPVFAGTASDFYWTSTLLGAAQQQPRLVDFVAGVTDNLETALVKPHAFRCVR